MKKVKMHYETYDRVSISLTIIITAIIFYSIVIALGFEDLKNEQAESAAGGMIIFGLVLFFGIAHVVEWSLFSFIDNGRKKDKS